MVKKRLSDLLRDEVNKSADKAGQAAEPSSEPSNEPSNEPANQSSNESANEPSNESANQSADQSAKSTGAKPAKPPEKLPASSQPTIDSADSAISKASPETPAEAKTTAPQGEPLRLGVHPSQQNQQDATAEVAAAQSARRNSPTKAELETTIAELKTQLETAQQQKESFDQQIDHLQAEVKRQQSVIDQLQAEMQQSKSLRAELEEARQVILKLSEINVKPVDAKYASKEQDTRKQQDTRKETAGTATNGVAPTAHLHYVKAGESQPIPPQSAISKSGAPIVPAPSNAAEPELESKPVQFKMPASNEDAGKLAPPSRHQQELRRILDHPIRPASLPPMSTPQKEDKKLSETDMGWVD
ncbi:hypothetical protein NDI45_15785 [Leptolyngbya sp. GB1-A1]|uniref:hypothetical protein n=1 Tax=Leptolyngbya sp. GB1-A1 TaxID=2933908 RepID=UPI003298A5EF